jgi:glycine cleavage system aminomethyltransferase T
MKKEVETKVEAAVQTKAVTPSKKYKLTSSDKKVSVEADEVQYIVWRPNGTFGSTANSPSVGNSLAMDLVVGESAVHVTDVIVEIVENTGKSVKFKTKDNSYELIVQK